MTDEKDNSAVADMVDSIIQGQTSDAQDQFNNIMSTRTNEIVDGMRQEKAADVFKTHSVDPDMEPQGVKLDDALVDIDQTTGRPVEGETNEDI
jgi:hypothetical protein